MTEPVADETRSILDGHVILSRKLAAANHYPAIDVLGSVSRVMDAIVEPGHRRLAGRLRELYAKYNEVELLVQLGEYKTGTDPLADEAIAKIGAIKGFLKQDTRERMAFAGTLARLGEILA
jgi:type III secretion protein N (ATPase)